MKPELRKKKLIKRDGDHCWLCGEYMGVDNRTIEHLIAKSNGGRNYLENLVLTHGGCNRKLGSKSLKNKLKMRNKAQEEYLLEGGVD